MMGARLEDPKAQESSLPAAPGLGLLPQCTIIEDEKVTRQSEFRFLHPADRQKEKSNEPNCRGYEIHMGRTSCIGDAEESPVNRLPDGRTEGYWMNERCWGTYMHGILDNADVLDALAEGFDKQKCEHFDYAAFKEEQYDKLADLVRAHIDLKEIYSQLTISECD
jgi:adenosylcobyric acid synthase